MFGPEKFPTEPHNTEQGEGKIEKPTAESRLKSAAFLSVALLTGAEGCGEKISPPIPESQTDTLTIEQVIDNGKTRFVQSELKGTGKTTVLETMGTPEEKPFHLEIMKFESTDSSGDPTAVTVNVPDMAWKLENNAFAVREFSGQEGYQNLIRKLEVEMRGLETLRHLDQEKGDYITQNAQEAVRSDLRKTYETIIRDFGENAVNNKELIQEKLN